MSVKRSKKQSQESEQAYIRKPIWPIDAPSLWSIHKVRELERKFPHSFAKADHPEHYYDLHDKDGPLQYAGLRLRLVREAFQVIAGHVAAEMGYHYLIIQHPRYELGDVSFNDFAVCPVTLRLALAHMFAIESVKPCQCSALSDDDVPF